MFDTSFLSNHICIEPELRSDTMICFFKSVSDNYDSVIRSVIPVQYLNFWATKQPVPSLAY